MNIDKNNIPQREIGEGEDELLNSIWEKLSSHKESGHENRHGFTDLQRRIHKMAWRKRFYRLTTVGSVAAVIAVCFLMSRPSDPVTGVYSQLQEMGVQVASNHVVLKIDDAVVMQLDSAASIENLPHSGLALKTLAGKKLDIAEARTLKIEVPAGCRFDLTLSDGSRVWLNSASSLEYPATFERSAERRVRLSGEAFFDVKRDTAHPFYVEMGAGESIRVLGTSFNVNAYPDGTDHITTLLTGKISYSSANTEQVHILLPNQQIRLNCEDRTMKLEQVDAAVYAAWKDGWIWFENEKLPLLADRLSRLYGIKIQVADRLKNHSFSGKIRFERGIDYVTGLLVQTTDIKCVVRDGMISLE